MFLSKGVLIAQNENSQTFGYALEWFPDVQKLLKELQEEANQKDLKFQEPCLTLVFEKTP
jgi:hypothetical protein